MGRLRLRSLAGSARWDMVSNTLEASRPKVMFSPMPVVNMKVTDSKTEGKMLTKL